MKWIALIILLLSPLCLFMEQSQPVSDSDTLEALLLTNPAVCVIPPGVYKLDRPLILTQDDQWIEGRGVTLRRIKDFVGDAVLVAVGTPEKRLRMVTIDGLKIDCGNSPTIGIKSDWTYRLSVERCAVERSTVQAGVFADGWDTHIIRSRFMHMRMNSSLLIAPFALFTLASTH